MRSGDRRRGTHASESEPDDEQHLEHPLHDPQVGQALGVVLPPIPERERRVAVDLVADGAVVEDACGVPRGRLEEEDEEDEHGRDCEPEHRESTAAPRLRIAEPERQEQQRRELRPARDRDGGTARDGGREREEAPDEQRRSDRVVRVRARRVLRERPCDPRKRERGRESRPAEAAADERQPEDGEQVEEDRGEMHGGQGVPLAAPAEDRIAGQVRDVRHRPVGVSVRVRVLAPAVRLDAVAHLAVGVGRAALGAVVLDREVTVGALPVRDAVGADDARIADVDHIRCANVQADAEAGDEDRRRGQHPDRPDRRTTRRAVRPRDPHAAHEQPDERRIRERHRREDIAAVEEPERHRERDQDEEVDVADRQKPPPVDEPDEEQPAEREPHPGAVDLRAAECALVAAGHLPGDLRPGPGLGDRGRGVVDLAGRDLTRLARPDAHRPDALRKGRIRHGVRRIPLQPGRDLRVREEVLDHLAARRSLRLGRRDLRRRDRRGRPRVRRR